MTSSRRGPLRSSTAPRSPTPRSRTWPTPSAWLPTRPRRPGAAPPLPSSRIHQQSLFLLIDAEISKQYAEKEGLEASQGLADAFFSEFKDSLAALPENPRTVLEELFTDWSESRAVLVEAGSKATGQAPSEQNVEQLLNAGLQERAKWLKDADIDTDPRYAPGKDGLPGGGDISVSEAGSDFAKDAGAQEADPEWVAALPANQKCG